MNKLKKFINYVEKKATIEKLLMAIGVLVVIQTVLEALKFGLELLIRLVS
ncbi:hypothetical protein [Psittacicella hinzii]|nr:hypothetical protein [Psittacicella hinzii]